jgi:allophanate hydrolase subunit 2
MPKLITVRRAKEEIKRLQEYIDLVESYEADTIEKLIIKEYAFTNSIFEVIRNLDRNGIRIDNKPLEKNYVVSVINGKANDKLHRLIKSGYLLRTKHSRNNK